MKAAKSTPEKTVEIKEIKGGVTLSALAASSPLNPKIVKAFLQSIADKKFGFTTVSKDASDASDAVALAYISCQSPAMVQDAVVSFSEEEVSVAFFSWLEQYGLEKFHKDYKTEFDGKMLTFLIDGSKKKIRIKTHINPPF